MQPVLVINGHTYTQYVEELSPQMEALDADGSGRDVQSGQMFRTKVADKLKITVKMIPIRDTVMYQLATDLKPEFYTAQVLNPETNTVVEKTFYTAARPFGVQRYIKDGGYTRYDGVSFSMTER